MWVVTYYVLAKHVVHLWYFSLFIYFIFQTWQRNKYDFDEWILALHVLPHIINFFYREWCFFLNGVYLAIFFFVLRHFYAHLLKTFSYLSNIEPRPIYHYRIYTIAHTHSIVLLMYNITYKFEFEYGSKLLFSHVKYVPWVVKFLKVRCM